ncbi:hypothetical protein ACFUIW_18565 [Streptomyces sp. NPDC057245]|uniref:hypothetical protein n=1 Tax=Streptomyces TaxID=1883 RepID=UPI001C1DEE72|nr:hypothetical protein [Streptomyces sp. A108]MBU6534494.1 hypothetical protein [Streptomyces sp. A108]
MNDAELIENLRARPSMYGLDGTYYPTATYLLGMDQALSGGLLRGFDEWLAVRRGEYSGLGWVTRVLKDAVPGLDIEGPRTLSGLTAEQNRRAVAELFSLVLEFLRVRNDRRALSDMYVRHRSLSPWES